MTSLVPDSERRRRVVPESRSAVRLYPGILADGDTRRAVFNIRLAIAEGDKSS